MEEHLSTPIKIARFAEIVGVSERQFERLFEVELGKRPSEFYHGVRLKAARRQLLHSTGSLEEIAEATGFSSLGYFSRAFKERFGEPPSLARKVPNHGRVGSMQESGDRVQRVRSPTAVNR